MKNVSADILSAKKKLMKKKLSSVEYLMEVGGNKEINMITFIAVTIITLLIWIPTIIRAKKKGEAAAVAAMTYALSLSAAAATRYRISL
jgi:hypothetical protein